MLHLFKLEFKRAFFNKNLLISLSIGLLMIFISISSILGYKNDYTSVEAWMRSVGMGGGIIILFVPILASVVYSSSLSEEKNNRYLQYIYVRAKSRDYLIAKGAVNALIGGLSIFIPCILLFIIVTFTFKSTNTLGVSPSDITSDPFSYIINYNNSVYLIIQCLWVFFQGMVWSTFSYAISLITNKFIRVIMIPFIYYIGANFLFAMLGLGNFTPPSSFAPYSVSKASFITMFTQPIIIISISIGIVMFYLRYRDEYFL